MNVNIDLISVNREKCTERFDVFVKNHDEEMERLSGKKNLSSMAI